MALILQQMYFCASEYKLLPDIYMCVPVLKALIYVTIKLEMA